MCAICFWKRKIYSTKESQERQCIPDEVTPTEDTTTDTVSSTTTEEEDMDLLQESSVVKSPQRLQDKK